MRGANPHAMLLGTRTTALYVGHDRVLAKTASGLKMFLDARDRSIAPHIMLDGVWEESTEAVLRKLVKPGMCVLEIGANVGYFTLVLAQLVGAGGRVAAFEADPDLAQIVRENIEMNGFHRHAAVHAQAVSDGGAEELTFYRAIRHRGNGSLLAIEQTPHNPEGEREAIVVPATTIDAFARSAGITPTAIKIDAEGAEPAILRGATHTLADPALRVLMLEFSPAFVQAAGADPRAYLESIEHNGFRLSLIEHRKRRMLPATIEGLLSEDLIEIVALRD